MTSDPEAISSERHIVMYQMALIEHYIIIGSNIRLSYISQSYHHSPVIDEYA